jgi:large subunit ribosomal protein L14
MEVCIFCSGYFYNHFLEPIMIQPQTLVKITDNTGGKIGRVFKVLGGSKRRYARVGDVVVLSVQTAEPRKTVKKKEVLHAVVVRQKKPFRRKDGSYIRFDDNAVIILEKGKKEPKAGRVFGPIPRELAERGYQKIISLAPEVV